MAKYVLDTDICIYWLNGNSNIEKRILAAGMHNVYITVITECELYYGAYNSARAEENLAVIDTLRRKIRTLHTTSEAPLLYGRIKAHLQKSGRPLDDADLLIACITLASKSILVTNNTAHFTRVPGISLENWK